MREEYPTPADLDALIRDANGGEARPSRLDVELHAGQLEAVDAFAAGANVLIQCGRQWGKTTVVLQILIDYLREGGKRGGLLLPQFQDIERFRKMLEDDGVDYEYVRMRRELTFGAAPTSNVEVFTSERPNSLRGRTLDILLCDEFAHWRNSQEVYDVMIPTLYAEGGRWLIATTPPYKAEDVNAHKVLRDIRERTDGVHVIHGTSADNPKIAPHADQLAKASMTDMRRHRIEWEGIHILDPETTLFPEASLRQANRKEVDSSRVYDVVVSVDPTVDKHGRGDECGIIVCGRNDDGYVVLEDLSGHMQPVDYCEAARRAYHAFDANLILVETNQGGEVVRSAVQGDSNIHVEAVTAVSGKVDRASTVSRLYAEGRVLHARKFEALEEQMRYCVPGQQHNPAGDDRLDAMVHAINHLDAGQGWAAAERSYDDWVRMKLASMRGGTPVSAPTTAMGVWLQEYEENERAF